MRRRKKFEGTYQIAVLVGGIVGYVLLWLDSWSFWGRLLTNLFLINLFLVFSILPHELGHAIAARLVGWRVFQVVIGIGKSIYRRTFFGIIFTFCWLPILGITQTTPTDTRWFRLKRFFVLLAGPAVNGASAAAVLIYYRADWSFAGLHTLPHGPYLFVLANLFVLVANLWPFQLKTFGLPSDGKQLLKTISLRKKDQEELLALRYGLEAASKREFDLDLESAREWCEKGLALFPENHHLLNLSGVIWLDQQEYERARDTFVKLLARTETASQRYTYFNNIAYADALMGNSDLLPEADAYSKQAYEAAPWASSIVGTRGTVLMAMNQLAEGMELLKKSFETVSSPRNKAETACHLSMGHARMGDLNNAQKYLKLAAELDPKCGLLSRTEREVSALEPSATK